MQAVTYQQALKQCEDNGLRLCTDVEIQSDVGAGSGCSHDSRHVWTSTTCVLTDATTPKADCEAVPNAVWKELVASPPIVTVGPATNVHRLTASNCQFDSRDRDAYEISCDAPEGLGNQLLWSVKIGDHQGPPVGLVTVFFSPVFLVVLMSLTIFFFCLSVLSHMN
jgi:hypothetical protein